MNSFMICNINQILLRRSKQGEWDGWGMWHAWGEETNVQVYARNHEGQIPLGRPRQDGRIILKWIWKK